MTIFFQQWMELFIMEHGKTLALDQSGYAYT
jgi:hypothetical protein